MQGDVSLTKQEIQFLCAIRDNLSLRHADRQEDRARQRCRKLGLAVVIKSPRRWALTDAGRAALEKEARDD